MYDRFVLIRRCGITLLFLGIGLTLVSLAFALAPRKGSPSFGLDVIGFMGLIFLLIGVGRIFLDLFGFAREDARLLVFGVLIDLIPAIIGVVLLAKNIGQTLPVFGGIVLVAVGLLIAVTSILIDRQLIPSMQRGSGIIAHLIDIIFTDGLR